MEITTSFPGGNGCEFAVTGSDHMQFAADRMGGPCSMWFHFRVESPECDVLHCEMTRGPEVLGWPHRPHVRPVYKRQGGGWQRTAPTETDADAGRFLFEVPCARETTDIAFCYPYQLEDWNRFFEQTLAPAGARLVRLGNSQAGNALFACELGSGPHLVWLTARAHAGETPGSFALEGILAELARQMPAGLTVAAIPFVDLDGVVNGMYSKNRPPVDFYMGWGDDLTRLEIQAYKAYLDSLSQRPALAVDCHAPLAWHPSFIDSTVCDKASDGLQRGLTALVDGILAASASTIGTRLLTDETRPHPGWFPEGFTRSQPGFLQSQYGTLAITLEAAYHATHEGVTVGPDDWRELGRVAARCIIDQEKRRP